MFVGIYKGIIIPGFLRWCEMDFVHPQYDPSKLSGFTMGENHLSVVLEGGGRNALFHWVAF